MEDARLVLCGCNIKSDHNMLERNYIILLFPLVAFYPQVVANFEERSCDFVLVFNVNRLGME